MEISVEEDGIESFFSTMEEEPRESFFSQGSDEGQGIFASMGASEETSTDLVPLTRDILPEKTRKEEKTLSLDSLFAPIFDEEEMVDHDEEVIADLEPVSSGEFADSFLDDLLTLTPADDSDSEPLLAEREAVLHDEEDTSDADEPLVEVECYNCSTSIPIFTNERPLIITCPSCGIQGEIE